MSRRHPSISRTAYGALAAYRHALRHFLHFSTEAARAASYTQQQYQVLLAAKAAPPAGLTVGDLAATMHLRHHSAVGLVDRLARRGLLRRAVDREDRRRVRVRLTAKGDKVLDRLAAIHRAEILRLGPQLVRALRKLGAG